MKGEKGAGAPGTGRRLLRRGLFRVTLALTAAVAASGHAPYGQWNVYRKRNLLILTSRSDAPSFPLGERVAKVLAASLPESHARVSRAPNTDRVASLISTAQMDVAVLSQTDAALFLAGRAPFADYGPVPLRAIVALGDYLLVCREDFPPLHAYLLAETLMEHRNELGFNLSPLEGGKAFVKPMVPVHRGALAYFPGHPPPED
jgi:TRAP-type uncharacterized transport system substrate-binding protein